MNWFNSRNSVVNNLINQLYSADECQNERIQQTICKNGILEIIKLICVLIKINIKSGYSYMRLQNDPEINFKCSFVDN